MELTLEMVRAINEILKSRNQAEVKVENGKIVVIEVRRKKNTEWVWQGLDRQPRGYPKG